MFFIPVRIGIGAGDTAQAAYARQIELTVRQLAAFEHEAGNMLEPLTIIGKDLHTQLEAAFATEGATGASGKWVALSETYGAWKAQRSSAPILVGLKPLHKGTREDPTRPETYAPSGKMRYELLDPLATHVTARRLLYAPTSDIAGYHESGTEKMPARPPVDLSLTFLHSVDRTFAVWLANVITRLGL